MCGAVVVNAPATLAVPAGFIPTLAITLWLGLIGVAVAVLLAAGALAWWQRRETAVIGIPEVTGLRTRKLTPEDLTRLLAEVNALNLQAVSAGATAADTESAVAAARIRCRAAELARERAWQEYDSAQRAYVAVLRTSAAGEEVWPTASTSGAWPVLVAGGARSAAGLPADPTVDPAYPSSGVAAVEPVVAPAEPAVHEGPGLRSEMARAALAAYRRGGISVEQLREVLRHSVGWDHVHARHDREVLLRRAAHREAHRRYSAATAAERSAYQAVDVARVAAQAWADEAAVAAEEARLARAFANECRRRAAVRRRLWRLGRWGWAGRAAAGAQGDAIVASGDAPASAPSFS
jgi:hypothetical protein